MKQRKILILFFGIVSLVFSLNEISSTYAKYSTSTKASTNINIARWDIMVNDTHIKNGKEESVNITPNYIDNPNVTSGTIAPGSVGYFDIKIDASLTDVSFDYDIVVNPSETSIVSDLKILKYYIDDVSNIKDAENDTISDSIDIAEEKLIKTIRIYIIWDDENGMMSNEEDSIAGHNASEQDASINVTINFKQKI